MPGGDASYGGNSSEPPPSYTEATTSDVRTSRGSQPEFSGLEAPLAELLQRIPTTITTNHEHQINEQIKEDYRLVEYLVPYIRDFFMRLQHNHAAGGSRDLARLPKFRAELYLVPDEAVPDSEGWKLSGAEYIKQECGYFELANVCVPIRTKEGGLGKMKESGEKRSEKEVPHPYDYYNNGPSNSKTVSVSGERLKTWWWKNEDQARFLARYLNTELATSPSAAERSPQSQSSRGHIGQGGVYSTVRAEEMTFRRENEMGLWESKSGWTIIFTVVISH